MANLLPAEFIEYAKSIIASIFFGSNYFFYCSSAEYGAERVFPYKLFCDSDIKDRCVTHNNDFIFYADDDHLSSEGSKLVSELAVDQMVTSLMMARRSLMSDLKLDYIYAVLF